MGNAGGPGGSFILLFAGFQSYVRRRGRRRGDTSSMEEKQLDLNCFFLSRVWSEFLMEAGCCSI